MWQRSEEVDCAHAPGGMGEGVERLRDGMSKEPQELKDGPGLDLSHGRAEDFRT